MVGVTACLVTRGNVDMKSILDSLPPEWEIIIWDNDQEFNEPACYRVLPHHRAEIDEEWKASDLSVYGRYAAIEYATNDLIFFQDDDVIVSDPQAIVNRWIQVQNIATTLLRNEEYDDRELAGLAPEQYVVCNQPQEFRHDFYSDHSLVGFGASFHRDAPRRAFERFEDWYEQTTESRNPSPFPVGSTFGQLELFHRTCDIVFTGLTPCVRVDVPKENLPYAYADDRMWRQPTHQAERQRMLDLVRRVRDER